MAIDGKSFEALSVRNAQISIRKIRFASVQIIYDLDDMIEKLPLTVTQLISIDKDFTVISANIINVIDICRRRGCDLQETLQQSDGSSGMQPPASSASSISSAAGSTAIYGNLMPARVSNQVEDLCTSMAKSIQDFSAKRKVNNGQLEATLRKLKERFSQLVDYTIQRECKVSLSSPLSAKCFR